MVVNADKDNEPVDAILFPEVITHRIKNVKAAYLSCRDIVN